MLQIAAIVWSKQLKWTCKLLWYSTDTDHICALLFINSRFVLEVRPDNNIIYLLYFATLDIFGVSSR